MLSLFVLILAACGGSDDASATKDEEKKEATEEQTASEETTNEEMTITHELGETTIQKNPEKVVVFNYGTLNILDQIGVDVAGVAKSTLPDYLSKFEGDDYENVGSLKEPDFEKIHEMSPDLIIISGRQSDAYEDLSEIAPTLYLTTDTENFMDSYKEGMNTLGELFTKGDKVKEEIARVEKAVASIQETTEGSDKKGLIILSTGGKVSAYGPGSRFGVIHDVFGVQPADENIEASNHGMNISFEYIREQNPDTLFVIDRDQAIGGETVASEVLDNELVNGTTAAKEGNIVYLDPGVWYLSSGISPVGKMAEEVQNGLE
ncbi:iron ABC transporter substrate-binding protein [Pontibacillus halophilus JSM 076056 = DSM 19796]|uniref:Iron ABC transporter substrate-binding protein n=1 Tax=Pontibacillus halophilus JSM 076056 = DSM 19796 TaxID=1385510 RepID=A0A0A5GIT1_9BACI|nr:iron ABC transporter substrate-binding protein [Pontibacillus halophilus JSM 076056 = DSM 19796]